MAAVSDPFPNLYDHKRYFFETLGLSERLLERCLGEALSAGGDFADLYFEAVTSTSLGMDEGIVKTAAQGVSVGCGVRVLSGERTGFAYTDDLSAERLLKAARTAALIASGPQTTRVAGFQQARTPQLYPVAGSSEAEISAKLRNGYIRDPSVAVEIDSYRPFFILGEVQAPGQYPYVPNMTVESAVAIAGGFTPRAKRNMVTVTHTDAGGPGRYVVPMGTSLSPGDTVFVGERWF